MSEIEIKELARDIARTYLLSNKECINFDLENHINTYIRIYKAALRVIREDEFLNNSKSQSDDITEKLVNMSVSANVYDVYEAVSPSPKAKKPKKRKRIFIHPKSNSKE